MDTLKLNARGAGVRALQKKLKQAGFDPGTIDGQFGLGTEAAVMAYQRSEGLLADGVAGPRTLKALGLAATAPTDVVAGISIATVSRMFPHTPLGNIKANWPPVSGALTEAQLIDQPMVLMALATIRAETESFQPVGEGRSRYNTSPNGHDFDLYDNRRDLGNQGAPDGERYRGRGYIQLTGRHNYAKYGERIGLGKRLLSKPDMASEPAVAARLLATFLRDKEMAIKQALLEGDLRGARRLVNGGSHGLDRFSAAYNIGVQLLAG